MMPIERGWEMDVSSVLFGGIAVFSAVCVIAVLFFERKNPASSLVWVMVLLFMPVAGFIFYLFLGSGFRISKKKLYLLKAARDEIYNNHIMNHLILAKSNQANPYQSEAKQSEPDQAESDQAKAVPATGTPQDASPLPHPLLCYLANEADGPVTDNNQVDIFVDGQDLFEQMLIDLRAARHHIHILFYIFRNDELGRKILAVLTDKALAGIEVRLIYDSIGTFMASRAAFRELQAAGGKVEPFAPVFSSLSSHLRLNYRNHRKIVVIDGLIGYVGGMNVGTEYLGQHKNLSPWRDTHLRFTGSGVWFLQERFLMDWSYILSSDPHQIDLHTYFPDPIATGTTALQIVSSGPDTKESPIKAGMIGMIYSAKKSVYIQSPYFAPDDSFADALRFAARGGVDVRLMIPELSDYQIVHMATLGYARDLQKTGVKIYYYHGFIHAKTVAVDGVMATIGTTNITNRSFTLDFEVNAFIYDPEFCRRCLEIFHEDEKKSMLLTDKFYLNKNPLVLASYNFARMFAPMM